MNDCTRRQQTGTWAPFLAHICKSPCGKSTRTHTCAHASTHTDEQLLCSEYPSSVQSWASYRSSCHSSVSPFTKRGSFSTWQYVVHLTFTGMSHGIKRRAKQCNSAWHLVGSVPPGQIILTVNFWKILPLHNRRKAPRCVSHTMSPLITKKIPWLNNIYLM